MKKTIKALSLIISICIIFVFAGCGSCGSCSGCSGCGGDTNKKSRMKNIDVWVYSEQTAQLIRNAFLSDNPALEWGLDIKVVDAGSFSEEFEQAKSENKTPDVVLLSPDNLSIYLDSGDLADLLSLGLEPDAIRCYPYAYDMGFDSENIMRAMCWQADPTLFFYRRSIAKYYLGTDDPTEISGMLSTRDGFLSTARKLSELSTGRTRMLAGTQDIIDICMSENTSGWFGDGGNFKISSTALNCLDLARTMTDEKLTWNAEQYSPAWLSGMSDGQSVFGYFMSSIELESILKKACGGTIPGEGTFGDWGAVTGFAGCNLGGSWMAVCEQSDQKEQALYFVSYFTCETEAMKKYFLASGDFSADSIVSEQIKFDSQFTESFLGGQNYYSLLAQSAERIPMKKHSAYDTDINAAFSDCVKAYSQEYKTRDQALSDFETTVRQITGTD